MRRQLAMLAVVGGMLVASSVAAGQQPARKYVTPRTPWGDPDLQGLWPSIDMQGTPLERPDDPQHVLSRLP